jgi:SAM-dependent methyltransferase
MRAPLNSCEHCIVASFSLAREFDGGILDALDVEPSGQILLSGWTRRADDTPRFHLLVDGVPVERREEFRLRRPDVATFLRSSAVHHGFGMIFAAPVGSSCSVVRVQLGDAELGAIWPGISRVAPHYAHLFDESRVLHREDIYRYGPPTTEADPQILDLVRLLPGPLLDFGCGSGSLVRALRREGVEAEGIEVQRPEIVASLREDVRPYVELYDGRFPLPYANERFGAVVCSEVLEHIPEWEHALREIGRIARRAVITVPDMSSIPSLFPHGVVPWHLLESTHVNFFTQSSLRAALSRTFSRIRFMRLGEFLVNGTRVFTSVLADCQR